MCSAYRILLEDSKTGFLAFEARELGPRLAGERVVILLPSIVEWWCVEWLEFLSFFPSCFFPSCFFPSLLSFLFLFFCAVVVSDVPMAWAQAGLAEQTNSMRSCQGQQVDKEARRLVGVMGWKKCLDGQT